MYVILIGMMHEPCLICQFTTWVCLLCQLLLKRLLFSSHLSLSCKTRFLSDNPKLLSDFTEAIASSLQIFKMARDICHLTSHSGIEIHKLILLFQRVKLSLSLHCDPVERILIRNGQIVKINCEKSKNSKQGRMVRVRWSLSQHCYFVQTGPKSSPAPLMLTPLWVRISKDKLSGSEPSNCYKNKTISDGGITIDFSIIKVHTFN